jgi:hypothetical protein
VRLLAEHLTESERRDGYEYSALKPYIGYIAVSVTSSSLRL